MDDVFTVNVVQVDVVPLKMKIVHINLVNVVLTENVFVVMVVVDDFLVLVVLVDDFLGCGGVSLEGLDFVGGNDLLGVVMVLTDLSWANRVSGTSGDDFFWGSVNCWS